MLQSTRLTPAALALLVLAWPTPVAAQTPSGGLSSLDVSQSQISVGVDPQKGASAGVDAGDAGSVSVGAGPQGVSLGVTPAPAGPPPSPAQPGGQSSSAPSGSAPAGSGPGKAPVRTPAARGGTGTAAPASGSRTRRSGSASAGVSGERDERGALSGRERRVGANPAAERGTEDSRGVPPFLEFVERIPEAVRAGVVALALIAIALWMLWVRGRRRLERNAYVDADSGLTNMPAFESLLAQEWSRAVRYQRPLGLLLVDVEGGDLSDARKAIHDRVREADIVATLRPSRFAVICPEGARGSVETLAHALERSLEMIGVHARAGVAERQDGDRGPADLIARAATALEPQTAADVTRPEPVVGSGDEPSTVHAAA